ncbi:MAG: FKBP-type peptidyl-prolyl cis-trans isomerase [Bacteroidaceae bacterium]|nr:FKBP-type peptidyl-prolyl cis-trans isomerase [Bacteroidaceae bacterium]
MKRPLYIIASFILFLTAMSCQEQDEVAEFDNWQQQNERYLDSLATVARKGNGWTMYKSFNLGDPLDMNANNNYYIYVQKLENGTGTEHPLYNDSVRVHYIGHLIPSASYPDGYCFDKSFKGDVLNIETDVPTLFGVNGLVKGFSTALMNMVEGDHWRVVIPYYIGYGTSEDINVPGYSTLIFEMYLARIYRYQKDTNTQWY